MIDLDKMGSYEDVGKSMWFVPCSYATKIMHLKPTKYNKLLLKHISFGFLCRVFQKQRMLGNLYFQTVIYVKEPIGM